jgi:hypothetical protein
MTHADAPVMQRDRECGHKEDEQNCGGHALTLPVFTHRAIPNSQALVSATPFALPT